MDIKPQNQPPGRALGVRLCMDARMLVTSSGTGVSSYAREIRRAHATIAHDHALLTDRLALDGPASAPFGRPGRWLRALVAGPRWARALVQPASEPMLFSPDIFRLAQVYFDVHRCPLPVRLPGPPGIMHWTYPVPLTVVGWHNLYTVHDVIPLLHPTLTEIDGHRYRRLLDRLAQGATRFIAVSQTARAEIVDRIGCPPSFVIDCGLAIDAAPAAALDLPGGLTPQKYLLICGTVEKRKNIAATLAAYRQSGVTMPLVIAGPDGWSAEDVAAAIATTPGVLRLPYLDRALMRALIGQARALVMPSLAEGFGLPVAEAMALGVPVITSDRGALVETAGGAALLVDPDDPASIAGALRRLADDDTLCGALAIAGRANAARFAPQRFAERLTRAYAAVMAER